MRIIQDSEDEDDFEIEEAEAAAQEKQDPPPNHVSSNTSKQEAGEKGTGSTESLKRAIVAAHRAQFRDTSSERQGQSNSSEVPPSGNGSARSIPQDAPESSVSLPGDVNKQKRTSLDGSATLPSTRDVFPTTYSKRHAEKADYNTNAHLGPTPDIPWNLQGTMRAEWEHHEPMGMFPPGSSTIPYATGTQLLAEVLAPEFLGVDAEHETPRYEPAKSSVPWSEYLKSSIRSSQEPEQAAGQPSLLSQNKVGGSATQPSANSIVTEPTTETIDLLDAPPLPSTIEQVPIIEATVDTNKLQSEPDHTFVSTLGKTQPKPGSNSEDDLMAIGLSMEQYKPRPSRSRSEKLSMEDPVDYSRRPEAVAKRTRRTRTSGDVEKGSTATTPEKVQQICDMGFTPSSTKRALRQHNGDVTHTVDWLIANGLEAEDELAPPKPSNSKNKRKSRPDESPQDHLTGIHHTKPTESAMEYPDRPVDMSHTNSADGILENEPTTVAKSPTVVKVVIPKTKKPAIPSKREEKQAPTAPPHEYTMEDTSENSTKHPDVVDRHEPQSEDQPAATDQPPKGKKRGRGRPKKEEKTAVPVEEEVPVDKTHDLEEPIASEDILPKDKIDKPGETALGDGTSDEHQADNVEAIGPVLNAACTTPEPPPPEKKAKHSIDTPSSINKGKTSYRVGLSKRARIAPLLRIVKK